MTKRVLILCSTIDGHTRQICERLAHNFNAAGLSATIEDLTPSSSIDPPRFDAMVIGASIRYGKHRQEVTDFIEQHREYLESTPSAFFSVNAVARKPEKRAPDTNPYVKKFLGTISWRPPLVGIFGGKIDYPKYGVFDRNMIRLIMWITKGPTDVNGTFEFTDWDAVDAFGKNVSQSVRGPLPAAAGHMVTARVA